MNLQAYNSTGTLYYPVTAKEAFKISFKNFFLAPLYSIQYKYYRRLE